jgi:hypothetical protein
MFMLFYFHPTRRFAQDLHQVVFMNNIITELLILNILIEVYN